MVSAGDIVPERDSRGVLWALQVAVSGQNKSDGHQYECVVCVFVVVVSSAQSRRGFSSARARSFGERDSHWTRPALANDERASQTDGRPERARATYTKMMIIIMMMMIP